MRTLIDTAALPGVGADRVRAACRDFFTSPQAHPVLKQGTYKTILAGHIGPVACLVKIYGNPGLWRSLLSLGKPSRARREFAAARAIRAAGIPTARPLCMAEQRAGGLVSGSLVALEFLDEARELRDVFFRPQDFSASTRHQIVRDFGHLTAAIFRAGIDQNDYSLNNFMVRCEDGTWKIYFIDFERVRIRAALAREEQIGLLAKLNRVGAEVRSTDRLRFVQAWAAGSGAGPAGVAVREVQAATRRQLGCDLERGRLTSLYTHGTCDRIRTGGCAGLVHRDCAVDSVLAHARADNRSGREVQVRRADGTAVSVRVLCFQGGRAARMWALVSMLRIAGWRIELPIALVEQRDGRGWIFLHPQDCARLAGLSAADCAWPRAMAGAFAGELAELRCLLATNP